MTTAYKPSETISHLPILPHPLEPLIPEEIEAAVAIIKTEHNLNSYRFESVTLNEPPKFLILNYTSGESYNREAFLILLDNSTGFTYEAVVSLTGKAVMSWKQIPSVQPRIMLDEFMECENTVKANPDFQEALRKRGIEDVSLVMVDPWSAGNFGVEDEEGKRLTRTFCWIKTSQNDNGYARPIEGVVAVVDLNKMEVLKVEDYGVVPIPPNDGNYAAEFTKTFRTDLKPLEIIQPEGASFTVEGHQVSWQKWQLRLGFNPREGLVLYQIGYEDGGKVRPIIYRASLAEMVVPYGGVTGNHYRKNAFDVGEYGIGMLANSLKLGCDCLGEIHYFDAFVNTSRGEVMQIENAVCMHEEDYGILWKHQDWRTGHTDVRRSRRLVISFIATVGNYEYGFFWYFYQDGTIQYEVKLTGIMNTSAVPPGVVPKYGTLVAPQLEAQIHQHFFNVRLDMQVDGVNNSVYEVNTESVPIGEENPFGNAFYAQPTLLATEQEAQRQINPMVGRYWKIVNPSVQNNLGQMVGYKLMPGENVGAFAHPDSALVKRAGFITKHLWVTPYNSEEKYPAGNYPNQNPGGEGLPAWTQANRSVEDTDVVVWYTFGAHHIPRPEDYPVMPVGYIGFMLKPVGFFEQNPALDVPPSAKKDCCH